MQVVCLCGASSAFCPTRGLDGCHPLVRTGATKPQRKNGGKLLKFEGAFVRKGLEVVVHVSDGPMDDFWKKDGDFTKNTDEKQTRMARKIRNAELANSHADLANQICQDIYI